MPAHPSVTVQKRPPEEWVQWHELVPFPGDWDFAPYQDVPIHPDWSFVGDHRERRSYFELWDDDVRKRVRVYGVTPSGEVWISYPVCRRVSFEDACFLLCLSLEEVYECLGLEL